MLFNGALRRSAERAERRGRVVIGDHGSAARVADELLLVVLFAACISGVSVLDAARGLHALGIEKPSAHGAEKLAELLVKKDARATVRTFRRAGAIDINVFVFPRHRNERVRANAMNLCV